MAAKTNVTVISTIKRLISLLKSSGIHIDFAYLFGSYAKGAPGEWSDIDVALISKDFAGNRMLDKQKLIPFVLKVDSRIEIHPYKTSEFNEEERWFVKEIISTGIKIT